MFAAQTGLDPAVLEQALKVADAMAAWPVKKFSDASHLDSNDAKQLRYEYARRKYRTENNLEGPKL